MYDIAEDLVHRHCQSCYSMHDCRNESKEYAKEQCEVIKCPNSCGFWLHKCKVPEHVELVCPAAKVPCPCWNYGCQFKPQRNKIANHLMRCPANVVHCNFERNRKVLNDSSKIKLKHKDHGKPALGQYCCTKQDILDVFLAISDQTKINDSYQVSKEWRKRRSSFLSKHHPVLPFNHDSYSSAGNKAPRLNNDQSAQDTDQEDEDYDMETAAVSVDCVKCRFDPGSQHLHTLGSISHPYARKKKSSNEKSNRKSFSHQTPSLASSPFYQALNLLIDLSLDFLAHSYPKTNNYYTFVCDHVVRRQEYPWHYANIHAEILSGLDGWMLARCPMHVLGCGFIFTRLVPDNQNSSIAFDRSLDNFYNKCTIGEEIDETRENSLNFADILSSDLWRRIGFYLDSWSLYCLSMTCQKLRSVCQSLLPFKGMVELKWRKTGSKWTNLGKKWTFSTCFEPVRKWRLDDGGKFCEHIQKCPYYEPMQYDGPVPVLTFLENENIKIRK